jgi:heat shock protein HslJ
MRKGANGPFFCEKAHIISGSNGCNRIMGGFQSDGNKLSFGQLASTTMACLDGADIADTFAKSLEQTAGWKITGNQLELLDDTGNTLARFEAVALR